jgi:hypothetical protein
MYQTMNVTSISIRKEKSITKYTQNLDRSRQLGNIMYLLLNTLLDSDIIPATSTLTIADRERIKTLGWAESNVKFTGLIKSAFQMIRR